MHRRCAATLLALVTVAGGCPRTRSSRPTPESAVAALARAGGDAAQLYDLLDQDSRWSVISVHRDLRTICELVRAQYPKDRQAPELHRCRPAELARDPRAFFVSQAAGWGLLGGLSGLTGKETPQGSGEQRTVPRAGGPPLLLCQTPAEGKPSSAPGTSWAYCGAHEELERLKLKTARDLASVQENAEAYRGR